MNPSFSIPWLHILQRWGGENALRILCTLLLVLTPLTANAHTAPQKAVAVFDYNPLTSLKANPTITGSASSSAPLHFKVTDAKGASWYDDPAVWISEGRFSETVYPPIPNGTYLLTMLAGTSTIASSTLTIGLRTMPDVQLDDSLPSSDIADGHLMRFAVRARGQGGVGISQLSFAVVPNNAAVADIFLYGYTDSGLTQPIVASSTDPLMLLPAEISSTSSVITIVPDQSIEVPANSTYYFELIGTVTPLDTTYNVETTLLGDTNPHFAVYADLASTSNFIWSPNTYGIASPDMHDWTNGSLVRGIPNGGLIEVRTNAPPADAPTCSLTASTTTAPAGTPVTLSWSSTGATSAVWDSGAKEVVSGTKLYTQGTSTHTYILNFYGPYGFTGCYATVASPYIVATTTVATTTAPTDGFTATPTTGPVSLAVTITGSVNNAKSCTAQTYSLGYGDGATSTIAVAKNLCKAQSFTFTHTYTKAGTFTAGLYSGTGTSSNQRIQTHVITPKAKVALQFNPSSNLANILSAFNAFLQWIKNPF